MITDFYQTNKNFLTEKVKKSFFRVEKNLKTSTPKQIIRNIILISVLILAVIARSTSNRPVNTGYLGYAPFGTMSMSTRAGTAALTTPPPTASHHSASLVSVDTNTQAQPKTIKLQRSKGGNDVVSVKKPVMQSSKVQKTNTSKKARSMAQTTLSTPTTTQRTEFSATNEEIDIISQKVEQAQKGKMTTCIRNIEGTNIVTPVGSRGCYARNRLINDIVKTVLEAHPDFISQVVDANHLNGRPMLESLGLSINNGATISTTQEVHKLKSKIDYTRKDHVESVTT